MRIDSFPRKKRLRRPLRRAHPLRDQETTTCTLRTDNALKIRFSATVGEEPEIELALVWKSGARGLLTGACAVE